MRGTPGAAGMRRTDEHTRERVLEVRCAAWCRLDRNGLRGHRDIARFVRSGEAARYSQVQPIGNLGDMAHFDVFNGDADGICALHQLRLARPREATLITGAKRDIALVERVPAQPGDSLTVLDISFDVNRAALTALLAK